MIKQATKATIEAPPEKPSPQECCASGCVPCIYDYYYDNLMEWEERNGTTLVEYEKMEAQEGCHLSPNK